MKSPSTSVTSSPRLPDLKGVGWMRASEWDEWEAQRAQDSATSQGLSLQAALHT